MSFDSLDSYLHYLMDTYCSNIVAAIRSNSSMILLSALFHSELDLFCPRIKKCTHHLKSVPRCSGGEGVQGKQVRGPVTAIGKMTKCGWNSFLRMAQLQGFYYDGEYFKDSRVVCEDRQGSRRLSLQLCSRPTGRGWSRFAPYSPHR